MRRWIQRPIPQMFHRRLLLLAAIMLATTAVLAVQTTNLTVVQGARLRFEAEGRLTSTRLIPTMRGTIYDRRGRVVARDLLSYDLAVDYSLLSGDWSAQRGQSDARARFARQWYELDDDRKRQAIEQHRVDYDQQVEQLWRSLAELTGIDAIELERRRGRLVQRIERMASSYQRRLATRRREQAGDAAPISLSHKLIAEQTQAHVLIEAVDDTARFEINRRIEEARRASQPTAWQQVRLRLATRRDFPWQAPRTVAIDRSTLPQPLRQDDVIDVLVRRAGRHFTGRVRDRIEADRAANYPYRKVHPTERIEYNLHGYLVDDPVGFRGVEGSQELHLRGTRGRETTFADGRVAEVIDPVPGGDVHLTIDMLLQVRLEAIMSTADPANDSDQGPGLMRSQPWHRKPVHLPMAPKDNDPLCGAALVLDVASGGVLGAVSVPAQRPEGLPDNAKAVERWDRINTSWLNRPVAMPYPPGSTVKPLVLAATYTDGELAHSETMSCAPGHLYGHRCWIYREKYHLANHGELTGAEAIMRSCNVFFMRCGTRLGAQRLADWYGAFGFGRLAGSGIEQEVATAGAAGRGTRAAALMAFGQGPVECTVLQLASAYAALARGGIYVPATFIEHPPSRATGRNEIDLQLDPLAIDIVMQGLELSANNRHGTTSRVHYENTSEPTFNIEGVDIFAKSGTAEAPDLRVPMVNAAGKTVRETVRQGHHAWVICLAKRPDSPRANFVVAVVVEYGGSGAAVAGPIVNQMLYALRAEGYL